MSEILNKDGQPVLKKFEDMDPDEKVNALRHGIGYIINLTIDANKKLDRILKEIDESIPPHEEEAQAVITPVPQAEAVTTVVSDVVEKP